ncbi:MAG: ATP-dependent helicase, partial [Myxococcota bacterium]
NTQAKRIEEELRVAGIPYRVFGGTRFFDRKAVKDAIAYLRVALNPRDELSLRRIINAPPRGLGAQSIARLTEHAEAKGTGLLQALRAADQVTSLSPRASRSAVDLARAIDHAARGFREGAFHDSARALFEAVDLCAPAASDPEAKRAGEQVAFLLQSIARVETRSGSDRDALLNLLHQMTLEADDEKAETDSAEVTLSSLHSAKGLEFDVVFLVGCVEGVMPHARVTDPKVSDAVEGDLEEERRLFYVGVTRARDLLYLTRPRERVHRGRLVKLTPSRFLGGLPEPDTTNYEREESRELDRQEVADMAKALLERLGSS